jgi:hypothetical protein
MMGQGGGYSFQPPVSLDNNGVATTVGPVSQLDHHRTRSTHSSGRAKHELIIEQCPAKEYKLGNERYSKHELIIEQCSAAEYKLVNERYSVL